MKNIYFTPGPSQAYPKINDYLHDAIKEEIYSISHRSKKFEEIYNDSIDGLRSLLNIPSSYHIIFLSSATEAMERVIQNTVFKKSFHIVNGAFGEKFYEIAKDLNKDAEKLEIDIIAKIPEIKVSKESEIICITQNETTNGFSFPLELIYQIKKRNLDKLIALDIVSSAPYIELNYRNLDMVFFSVQKGFGLPSGLAVLILSPAALEKAKHLRDRGVNIGSYHNFINLINYGNKNQTYETPNILNIYLLKRVVEDMNKVGIKKIRENIKLNSKLLYDFAGVLKLKPYIKIVENRSDTVIVLEVDQAERLVEKIKMKNIILGSGYGDLKNKTIRIANFPAHTREDFVRLINAIKSCSED